LPLARTILRRIWARSETPIAWRGEPSKRSPPFKAYHARSAGFGLTDLVIIYQEIGLAEEAKRTAEQLMAARPNFTIAGWLKTQFIRRDTARVEADTAALRAAGLPMD